MHWSMRVKIFTAKIHRFAGTSEDFDTGQFDTSGAAPLLLDGCCAFQCKTAGKFQ